MRGRFVSLQWDKLNKKQSPGHALYAGDTASNGRGGSGRGGNSGRGRGGRGRGNAGRKDRILSGFVQAVFEEQQVRMVAAQQ